MTIPVRKMVVSGGKLGVAAHSVNARRGELTFYRLAPTSYGMKMSQPELRVGLHGKMERVYQHWGLVNGELPALHPLVLLLGVGREEFNDLTERLPGLRTAMRRREQEVKLAWAAYERHKGIVHEWVRSINVWLRGFFRETEWMVARLRVPGRGRSYGRWWDVAMEALSMWKKMEQEPPVSNPGWPMDLGRGRTAEQFEAVIKAFEAAREAISPAEMEWKLARAALRRAQSEAAALLMAYGHGVRARLGQEGELVRTIPRVWPQAKAVRREFRSRVRHTRR
jgi:hypothetical protein